MIEEIARLFNEWMESSPNVAYSVCSGILLIIAVALIQSIKGNEL